MSDKSKLAELLASRGIEFESTKSTMKVSTLGGVNQVLIMFTPEGDLRELRCHTPPRHAKVTEAERAKAQELVEAIDKVTPAQVRADLGLPSKQDEGFKVFKVLKGPYSGDVGLTLCLTCSNDWRSRGAETAAVGSAGWCAGCNQVIK